VWAGIVGDVILGPFFLPARLTGDEYLNFLQNGFNELLDDVPLRHLQGNWFMHDGAPAHFAVQLRQHLNQMYPEKWIGRAGPIRWPPRSPDINPLDFCIWGYVKSLVYRNSINTLEELKQKIQDSFDTIKNKPDLCNNIRRSLQRRIQICVEMNGGHFEQFL
jgi:hypothetical protein